MRQNDCKFCIKSTGQALSRRLNARAQRDKQMKYETQQTLYHTYTKTLYRLYLDDAKDTSLPCVCKNIHPNTNTLRTRYACKSATNCFFSFLLNYKPPHQSNNPQLFDKRSEKIELSESLSVQHVTEYLRLTQPKTNQLCLYTVRQFISSVWYW